MDSALSPLDDYPVHQVSEPIRRVGTSDRNFYDRYYFNAHPSSGELFLIVGLGQYPNLGVTDAFALLRRAPEHGDDHVVVRASRALGEDRMDTSVGPFRVEVLRGLEQLRVVLEPGGAPAGSGVELSFDLAWEHASPMVLEPRHFIRRHERVVFDSTRMAQTGTWTGQICLDGTTYDVTPDRWQGSRDRSWGIRPVGEAEPPGISAARTPQTMFWIYAPLRFDDFSLVTIVQEEPDGTRLLEEAVRVWADPARGVEQLGRPSHALRFAPGTRDVTGATITYAPYDGSAPLVLDCEVLLPAHLVVGTGYGLEPDWRHGMWQGELVVQALRRRGSDIDPMAKLFGVVDAVARCELREPGGTMSIGYGLLETGTIGPHRQYGFRDYTDPYDGS